MRRATSRASTSAAVRLRFLAVRLKSAGFLVPGVLTLTGGRILRFGGLCGLTAFLRLFLLPGSVRGFKFFLRFLQRLLD